MLGWTKWFPKSTVRHCLLGTEESPSAWPISPVINASFGIACHMFPRWLCSTTFQPHCHSHLCTTTYGGWFKAEKRDEKSVARRYALGSNLLFGDVGWRSYFAVTKPTLFSISVNRFDLHFLQSLVFDGVVLTISGRWVVNNGDKSNSVIPRIETINVEKIAHPIRVFMVRKTKAMFPKYR